MAWSNGVRLGSEEKVHPLKIKTLSLSFLDRSLTCIYATSLILLFTLTFAHFKILISSGPNFLPRPNLQ